MKNAYLLLMLLFMISGSLFLLFQPYAFAGGFLLIMGLLTLLWLYSLYLKDASIIDVFWGLGFVAVFWYYLFQTGATESLRNWVLGFLVTIWGLRLALHIGIRNHGKGEDYRYQVWRKQGGKNYWWISYLRVFLLQGILLWIISSVFLVATSSGLDALQPLDYLGILLWCIGFYFEAVGDWQLVQFRKNPANKGQVLDSGLWRYTRHPNYFGDACLWWGFFMFSLATPGAWVYVFSPFLMTMLLMKVSGVSLLEKNLVNTKPKYAEYIRKTSSFFPFFPKK